MCINYVCSENQTVTCWDSSLSRDFFCANASNCVVKIKIDPQGFFHGNFQITEVLAIQTISRDINLGATNMNIIFKQRRIEHEQNKSAIVWVYVIFLDHITRHSLSWTGLLSFTSFIRFFR